MSIGAANWAGGAYVSVPDGGSVRLEVAGDDGAFVHPVVNRRRGQLGTSRYLAVSRQGRRTLLGTVDNGGLRETGVVEAEGLLRLVPLSRPLPRETVAVVVKGDNAEGLPKDADGGLDEDKLPEGALIGEIEEFAPAQVCSAVFNMPAGKYVLLCNITETEPTGEKESHFKEGMHTSLVVS